ncbi:MAG: glycosyltransferase family 4 protein [Chloroflexi bacterium]|nr:glycosyltransferase family 4 protein [Chloroflexota bacterium]
MHILVLTQFYAPEFGGSAVYIERIVQMMLAEGHRVTVLTNLPNYPAGVIEPPYRGRLFYRETIRGADVRRVWVITSPTKNTVTRLANQISFMAMAALRGTFLPRPDVILVESHPLFVCLSGGWIKQMLGAPVVLNVSDLWPASAVAVGALDAESLLVKVAEQVERWAYRDAAHVVAMTDGIRKGVTQVVPEDKVTLIQNAVDLTRFTPNKRDQYGATDARRTIRAQYGIGPDAFVVTHVGNMSLAHDFALIMDVVAALPEITFLFAGAGSQMEYVKAQIAERDLHNVILTGVLPHETMPAIWAAADACLIAFKDHALFEGALPTKMFEAMATATPVVAATRGEAQAVLESTESGIATPPGDRAAMIAAFRSLAASDKRCYAMGEAGWRYAQAHLAPERIKRDFLHIFNDVTGERRLRIGRRLLVIGLVMFAVMGWLSGRRSR